MAKVTREVKEQIAAGWVLGVPLNRLAEMNGITEARALNIVTTSLRARAKKMLPVADRYQLEAIRLDELQNVLFQQASAGDLDAAKLLLSVQEQRRRLDTRLETGGSDLQAAFKQSVDANSRIDSERDAALIAAGSKIAQRIDQALFSGEGQEVTKALYLVPHLNNILREMLATPLSRSDGKPVVEAADTPEGRISEFKKRSRGKLKAV